jgi:transposase
MKLKFKDRFELAQQMEADSEANIFDGMTLQEVTNHLKEQTGLPLNTNIVSYMARELGVTWDRPKPKQVDLQERIDELLAENAALRDENARLKADAEFRAMGDAIGNAA